MKNSTLFSRLFPTFFFILLASTIVLLLINRYALRNFYYQEYQKDLIQKARLLKLQLKDQINSPNLQELTSKLSELSESRITLVDPRGDVLADSNFNPTEMSNHANREEIKEALAGKEGHSIRYSNTSKKKFLYTALPLEVNGVIIGALRNSVPLDHVDESLYSLTRNILFWSSVLFIILTIVIFIQSKKISAPLEQLNDRINKFALENFKNNEKINLIDSTKEVSSLFSTINNMSEKLSNQFEKINKQKNEQLAVFASMLEGVITIYPDMTINHINKSAIELFNFQHDPNQRIKGTPLKEVVQSEVICKKVETLIQNQMTIKEEVLLENGLILTLHGNIMDSSSGIRGAVLVFDDITKIKELENHRKQFVANVSHELKTPLTAIQGYLETLKEENINDQKTVNRFLDIISKHSHRLKTIIEDLLTLSSFDKETGIGSIKLEKVSLRKPILNVISLCFDKADKKNIKIQLEGPDIECRINTPLIEQALINLIDNAIKYGPENTSVTIQLAQSENMAIIKVIDQGSGIAPEHHERLFERFYSVDKARSRELGGSGLGLSIVKHIALAHQGNVAITSTQGQGSTFILKLPLHT